MKKYKYSNLLLYRKKIGDWYSEFGLSFSGSNRISDYFKYLEEIEKLRTSDKHKLNELIKENKAKYLYSQFYVLEMCKIIDAVKNSRVDKNILKEKLKYLANGTYLLSEENINNTQARDTALIRIYS